MPVPIVNSLRPPAFSLIPDHLRSLREALSRFAKNEAGIDQDFRQRRSVLEYHASQALEQLEQNRAALATRTSSEIRHSESLIQSRAEHRAQRIQRAHASALRSVPRRAQRAREKWLGEIQHQRFLSERLYSQSIRDTDSRFLEATTFLTTARDRYAQLLSAAKKLLAGCPDLLAPLSRPLHTPPADAADAQRWRTELDNQSGAAHRALEALQSHSALRFFSRFPLPTLLPFAALLSCTGLIPKGPSPSGLLLCGALFSSLGLGLFLFRRLTTARVRPRAATLTDALLATSAAHQSSCTSTDAWYSAERDRIQIEFEQRSEYLHQRWNQADETESDFAKKLTRKLETQLPRTLERNKRLADSVRQRLLASCEAPLQEADAASQIERNRILTKLALDRTSLESNETARREDLANQWNQSVPGAWNALHGCADHLPSTPPAWTPASIAAWSPPTGFPGSVALGAFDIQLAHSQHSLPQSPNLALPGSPSFELPLALELPRSGNLLVECSEPGSPGVAAVFNQVLIRLLASLPPGKFSCTLFDPVGLGQNFAGLMHLADYEESLINRRIWTQRDQLEARLAELGSQIEKIIQMYLRDEYPTVADYNARAGVVSEKYHFLILADFPTECSEVAAKRLQSILASGARCGVFTLIHWNPRSPLPREIPHEDLRRNCLTLRFENGSWSLPESPLPEGCQIRLLEPPAHHLASEFVHRIGRANLDSTRVQVPFSQIAPAPDAVWSGSAATELRVPIGRTGATKQQFLSLGHGTRQHALLAGKTGSGKSTLLHVLITNLALHFSPSEVEFFLIDFKKGVEFKCYADRRLPHARVIAVESDRQFALSVLERIDDELRRRGEIFRALGVQDLAGYRKSAATEPLPRSLLLIDEFQEFFVEDDPVAQKAALLIDRIVRQGRAFGIHALLGSQTLGGAYTLARTTLGQMGVRIALQCNEADAYLIMDEDNSAPRLLSRPGEGIYNDAAGALEGNSPFQVVWLPDAERDALLRQVSCLAAEQPCALPPPFIFEGNAPALLPENPLLAECLHNPYRAPTTRPSTAWLGAPNAIKGPTEIRFLRQNGQNLLLVGQRQEAVLALFTSCILSLASQIPPGKAEFHILHTCPTDSHEHRIFHLLSSSLPHTSVSAGPAETLQLLEKLSGELQLRTANPQTESPQIFIILHDLHRNRKLRYDEDAAFSFSSPDSPRSPGLLLEDLLNQGSTAGIHILANLDSLGSVQRFFNRKSLAEFEMRVLFQMSPNDSSSLIDSPIASSLGLHRALLSHEQLGILETFRPYAVPTTDWLRDALQKLTPPRPRAIPPQVLP